MFPSFFIGFFGSFSSPMELAVVFLAVLMLFGAKSLPELLRTLGRWSEQLRRISREVQRELMEVEQPFRDAQKSWEEEMKDFTVSSSSRTVTPSEEAEVISKPSPPKPSIKEVPDAES